MMYLENVLSTMTEKSDVCVKLSSSTTYENGYTMQDCCGNHWVSNWMSAISKSLTKTFVVKSVEVSEMYGEEGRVQWTITLENVKDDTTNRLDYLSNRAAAIASSLCW